MFVNLLPSLLGGSAAITLAFVLLYRFSRLKGKEAAVVVALAVLGIYVPLVVVFWPGPDVFAIHLAIYLVIPYLLGMVASQRDARRAERDRRWFHWGPAVIVGFFLVVVTVNSIFVTLATGGMQSTVARWILPEPRYTSSEGLTSVFPGTVARDFHEKGELYNAYLAQAEQQRQRGWDVRQGWLTEPVAGQPTALQVSVHDKQGAPLSGARIGGVFLRPSDSRADQAFTMQETAPGVYRTEVRLAQPGLWDVLVQVQHEEGMHELQSRTEVAAAES